jgi:hypothetical protein
MSSQTQHIKRSYSIFYKVYRRMRFVRYKKKAAKNRLLEYKQKEIQEHDEKRKHLREFIQSEKQNSRIGLKVEKERLKEYKKELREEFRQRKLLDKHEWERLSTEEKSKQRQDQKEIKKQNRKHIRQTLKIRFNQFLLSFRSINMANFRRKLRDFRGNAPKRKLFILISLNSTVLFLLAYFVLFFLSQAITVLAASFFNYPTIIYYYEIYFNIDADAWFQDSVKTIFSAGPLVIFVIGISFFIIYNNIRESTGPYKLFFLWGFLHAVNMLFGALLVGTLFETGVGHVISWMYIMDTGKVLYSIISIFLLVIAGLLSTKQFLISANTYHNEMNKFNRNSFIVSQVFMPYLAGNAFLLLLRQPRFVFYDTFTVLILLISIIPVLLSYRSFNELYFEEEEKTPRFVWIGAAILAFCVLFFRGALEIGLRFSG